MTKDNLVFLLGGVIVGIIAGVVIANYSTRQPVHVVGPTSGTMQQQQQPQPASQQQLPEGHPPVDQAALQQEIARNEEILKTEPKRLDALISLGNLHYDLQQFDKASAYYEQALAQDPTNINVMTDLGTCYLRQNQAAKALEYYDKSLSIDPNHFQTLMNIGIARMATGNRQAAAEAWDKVIQLYPNNPETPMLRDAVKRLRENPQGTM